LILVVRRLGAYASILPMSADFSYRRRHAAELGGCGGVL
jgi:hypothetical protein